MRITKKTLREAKRHLVKRVQVLMRMDDAAISEEFYRAFPFRGPEHTPTTPLELRRDLIQDCIDRTIPDYWCE